MAEDSMDPFIQNNTGVSALTAEVDFEAFAHFLEGTPLSHAEKQDLLHALWDIAMIFVDLGFAVGRPETPCGQDGISQDQITQFVADALNSKLPKTDNSEADLSAMECFEKVTV